MCHNEQYIKMCAAAIEEIQNPWDERNPKGGDCYVAVDFHDAIPGVYEYDVSKMTIESEVMYATSNDPNDLRMDYMALIYLPRQEDIQKMLYEHQVANGCCNCGCVWLHQLGEIKDFANFICNKEEDESYDERRKHRADTKTWEELWLQLYMHTVHNKTWTGERWESGHTGGALERAITLLLRGLTQPFTAPAAVMN